MVSVKRKIVVICLVELNKRLDTIERDDILIDCDVDTIIKDMFGEVFHCQNHFMFDVSH
jgi:hypothetical protein